MSLYYRTRYNADPEFCKSERQRAAAYIDSRRDHYKMLWQARYAAKKLKAAVALVAAEAVIKA
jgi:hypothetical protein